MTDSKCHQQNNTTNGTSTNKSNIKTVSSSTSSNYFSTTSPVFSPITSTSSSFTANPIPTKSINFKSLDESVIRHNQNVVNSNSLSSSINQTHHSQTSPINLNNSITPPPSSVPSLDDLVNDCFLLSIKKLDDEIRSTMCNKFHNFLIKQHCQENLEFLIDIYRYEYIYNLKILSASSITTNNNSGINAKSSSYVNKNNHFYVENISKIRLNNSPSPIDFNSIPNNKATTTNNNNNGVSLRHGKTSSVASLDSMFKKSQQHSMKLDDLDDPQNAFVSTIDDLDLSQPWDNFKQQLVDDDDSDDEGELEINARNHSHEAQDDNDGKVLYINDDDLNTLNEHWDYLMNNFIKNDSPQQINISQRLFKEIVEESSITKLHNPLILMKARNEVIRMLKENGYFEFLSLCKKNQQSQQNSVKSSSLSSNGAKNCECGLPTNTNCSNNDQNKNLRTQCLNKNFQTSSSTNPTSSSTPTIAATSTNSSTNVSPIISPNPDRIIRTPNLRLTPRQQAQNKMSSDLDSNSISLPASILGKFSSSKRSNKTTPHQENETSSPTSSTPIDSPITTAPSLSSPISSSSSSSLSNLLGHLKFNGTSTSVPITDSSSTINSINTYDTAATNSSYIPKEQQQTQRTKSFSNHNHNHNHNFLHHHHHHHNRQNDKFRTTTTESNSSGSNSNSSSPNLPKNLTNYIIDADEKDSQVNRSLNSSPISINSSIGDQQSNIDQKVSGSQSKRDNGVGNANSSSLSSSLKFWRKKN
ncbi:hypothetical protein KGF54_004545 [Candida jiufengensis]|uniref:uncharacterized protein n=1 Tax=Candida jiufengensis TaxID=497108 RepID=UPI0022243C45|nr:uncharacterized protein KGF54_004545 [Candida jiufengensis]KAI5951471.1 hypothetical protein KGF54_004545 [Candida jiufengensis]